MLTTELILLLTAAALIMGTVVTVSMRTLSQSTPRLGARIEGQLATGSGFERPWVAPN